MSCNDPEFLGRLIYQTAQEIKNFAEKLLKPYDLTLEQFHILKHMPKDSGMSQREIGELVNKTPANITRILDRLELKKLIVRRRNKKDRRSSLVFLTDQGDSLTNEVFATFESFSSQLTAGISEKEKQATRKVLEKIETNIMTMSPQVQS